MASKQIKEPKGTWQERFWRAAVLRSEITGHHVIVSGSRPEQAREFIAQLPGRTQEMIQMRFEGQSVRQIARHVGLSDGRTGAILKRAVLELMWFLYHAN